MSGSPMKLPHSTQSNDIKAGILVRAQHNADGIEQTTVRQCFTISPLHPEPIGPVVNRNTSIGYVSEISSPSYGSRWGDEEYEAYAALSSDISEEWRRRAAFCENTPEQIPQRRGIRLIFKQSFWKGLGMSASILVALIFVAAIGLLCIMAIDELFMKAPEVAIGLGVFISSIVIFGASYGGYKEIKYRHKYKGRTTADQHARHGIQPGGDGIPTGFAPASRTSDD